MNTCSACKFWTPPDGSYRIGKDGFGYCDMPGDGDLPEPDDLACIVGTYGEGGQLITRPTFGCNEWESK